MQSWQIKALELEVSVLKHLDGFVHGHALYFLIGAIYLLLALLAWVLSGGLRRKLLKGKLAPPIRSVIAVLIPIGRPPLPPEPFNPFPPLCEPPHGDHDDCHLD